MMGRMPKQIWIEVREEIQYLHNEIARVLPEGRYPAYSQPSAQDAPHEGPVQTWWIEVEAPPAERIPASPELLELWEGAGMVTVEKV